MKNETARREIESLDYYLQNHTDDYSEESHTAMMMAVKALEQEPCEDAISRQAVLDIVDSYSESQSNVEDVTQDIISDIIALPSVNSQPKTGHWMIDEDSTDRFFATYECSCCKRAIIVPHDVMKAVYKDYPFCHCGAKMVDSQKSEG